MSQHQSQRGSDMGAAFMGLIGGALFIGAILYGIVVLTNRQHAAKQGEHKAGATRAVSGPVVG